MTDQASGQVTSSAADYYEKYFVPALFKERTGSLLNLAGVTAGNVVLDVGCGTGILARDAWDRMNGEGSVTGVDRNDGMIDTARRVAPDIEWRVGQAEALPFSDGSFDQVVSQFALFAEAGIPEARITTHQGMARFDSIKAWVDLDVEGWTLGELIGPQGHERLQQAAEKELQRFVQADGSVAFSSPSHIVTAVKR